MIDRSNKLFTFLKLRNVLSFCKIHFIFKKQDLFILVSQLLIKYWQVSKFYPLRYLKFKWTSKLQWKRRINKCIVYNVYFVCRTKIAIFNIKFKRHLSRCPNFVVVFKQTEFWENFLFIPIFVFHNYCWYCLCMLHF